MNISTGSWGGHTMIFARWKGVFSNIVLVVAVPLSFGQATEVVWTLSAGGHVQSTGESMDDRFYFELGGFADGFSPTASNFSAWSSMWTPFARKRFSPGGDMVIQGEVLEEFSEGAPGYVWAFNVDEPTREWALLSDMSWTWPESMGEGRVDLGRHGSHRGVVRPVEWRHADDGTRWAGGRSRHYATGVESVFLCGAGPVKQSTDQRLECRP